MSARWYSKTRKTVDLNVYQNAKKETSAVQPARQQTNIKLSVIYRRRSSVLPLPLAPFVVHNAAALAHPPYMPSVKGKNFTPLRAATSRQVQITRRRLYRSTKNYNLRYAHKAMRPYRLFTRRKKTQGLSYARVVRSQSHRKQLNRVGYKDYYTRRAPRSRLRFWERRRNYGALRAFSAQALRCAALLWAHTTQDVAASARKRDVLVSALTPLNVSTRKLRYGKFAGTAAACTVRRTRQFHHLFERRRQIQKTACQYLHEGRKRSLYTKSRKVLRARRATKVASSCRHQIWWIRHRPTKSRAKLLHPLTQRKLRHQTCVPAHTACRRQKNFLRQFKGRRRYYIKLTTNVQARERHLTLFRRFQVRRTRTFARTYAQLAQRGFRTQATPAVYSLAQFAAYTNSQLVCDIAYPRALAYIKFRQYLEFVAKRALLASMKPSAKKARALRLSQRNKKRYFGKSKALKNFSSSLRKNFFAKRRADKESGVVDNPRRYGETQQILPSFAPRESFSLLAPRKLQCLTTPVPCAVYWRRNHQLEVALRTHFAQTLRLRKQSSVRGNATRAKKRCHLWRKIAFPVRSSLGAHRMISAARSRFKHPKVSYWLRRRLQHLTRCRRRGYGQKMWRLRAGKRRLKNKFKFNFKRPPHTRKLLSYPLHKQNVVVGRLQLSGKHYLRAMLRLRFLKTRRIFAPGRRQKSFDRYKFSYRTRTVFVSRRTHTSRPRFFTNRWTLRGCVAVARPTACTLINANKLPLGLQLFYARLSAFDTLRTDRTTSFSQAYNTAVY